MTPGSGQPLRQSLLAQHDQELSKSQSPPTATTSASQKSVMSVESDIDSASGVLSVSDAGMTSHESTCRLLPACSDFYKVTKGKGHAANSTYGPRWATSCAAPNASDCNHGDLIGDITPTIRRFPHETPMDELKTWLYSPHALPNGATYTRSTSFLSHPRFSDSDLKQVLFLAIAAILGLHGEIEGLASYASRPPYQLRLESEVKDADYGYFDMRREHFEDVPRWGVEEDLLKAAEEGDLLRDAVEEARGEIRKAKKRVGVV